MPLLLFLIPALAHAFDYSVTEIRGKEAYVLSSGSSHRSDLQKGSVVHEGDTLETGARTILFLQASNGHKIHLGNQSRVAIREAGQESGQAFNVLELVSGSVRSLILKGEGEATKKFELKYKSANIGVRGTDFLTVSNGSNLDVYLNEGKLFLQNEVALTAGKKAALSASGEVLTTALLGRYEFAKAIERAGFGSEEEGGSGGGGYGSAPAGNGKSKESNIAELIRKGDSAGLKALLLSPSEMNDLGDGQSALHIAVQSRRSDMIPILLGRHADPNVQDKDGKTPLMLAIEKKDMPAIELLLGAGARKDLKDAKGRNAFDYGRASESREIQNLLVK